MTQIYIKARYTVDTWFICRYQLLKEGEPLLS